MDIFSLSKQRYTAKAYHPHKKIPEDQVRQLCAFLRNTPSSVNSQPWHFIVVSTDAGKNQIMDGIMDFNQSKVRNASHVIIFCARTHMGDAFLQNLLDQEARDGRFINEDAQKMQHTGRLRFVKRNNANARDLLAWTSKQVYIAMGQLMLAAASLGIDSTALEGIDGEKLDALLQLKPAGMTAVVALALGYHADDDFNAKLPKSRLPASQLFTFL